MFEISFEGSDGPIDKNYLTLLKALQDGATLRAAGCQAVTITDLSDGMSMPLAWWERNVATRILSPAA